MKNSNDTIWNRTSDLPIFSTATAVPGKFCTVKIDLFDTDADGRLAFLEILDVKKMFRI